MQRARRVRHQCCNAVNCMQLSHGLVWGELHSSVGLCCLRLVPGQRNLYKGRSLRMRPWMVRLELLNRTVSTKLLFAWSVQSQNARMCLRSRLGREGLLHSRVCKQLHSPWCLRGWSMRMRPWLDRSRLSKVCMFKRMQRERRLQPNLGTMRMFAVVYRRRLLHTIVPTQLHRTRLLCAR